jgi:hypothetical protein
MRNIQSYLLIFWACAARNEGEGAAWPGSGIHLWQYDYDASQRPDMHFCVF